MIREDADDSTYHPLVSIHKITRETATDARLSYDCHKTIAKYVESERKSVEIKSADGAELVHMTIDIGGADDDDGRG